MKTRITTAIRSGAALALLLAPQALFAGHYYEAVTVTDADRDGMDGRMTVKAWVDGDSTRIEFAEGDEAGLFGPGTYMVTRDAGETLYLVDTEEQTYSEFNLGQMMSAMNQMMEGMGGMFALEFTDLSSEKLSQGPGGSILGYDTEHLRYRTGYTMRMKVMGMKREQRVDMEQEVWVTEAFDPRAFAVWLRPDKRMGGMIEGLDEMMEAEFNRIEGVPLKSVILQTTTDKKGRTTTSTTTTEVQSLREEAIPAATFEIPSGYSEVELVPETGGESAPGEESGDPKRKRPRLRDIFGGGRDG